MADIYNLNEFRALKNYLSSVIINDTSIAQRAANDIHRYIGPVLLLLLKSRGVEDQEAIKKLLLDIIRLYSELLVINEHNTFDELNKALVPSSKIS